jgi:hypothetical protein
MNKIKIMGVLLRRKIFYFIQQHILMYLIN